MVRSKICLFIMLFFASCHNKTFDDTEEIIDFVNNEENNYCYKKEVNGVLYILQYRPTDLLVKQELGNDITENRVKTLREKYNKHLYFNLSMSLNGKELLSNTVRDKEKFGQMVSDLAFNMNQIVHLYSPTKDTLSMSDFIYPRMYGMSNSSTILIVYPRDKDLLKEDYLNFTIEDIGFNTGEVKFKINTQSLKNEPHLNF